MGEPNSDMDQFQPDPLLKPGAFIDPNLTSNGVSDFNHFSTVDPTPVDPPQPSDQKVRVTPNGKPKPQPSTVDPTVGASQPSDQKGETRAPKPDWLPPGWDCYERVRSSGASAGTRDKEVG
ncbi:Methyl-CpG-binding domain-containing protein 6 [Bienertia sinuspersici]